MKLVFFADLHLDAPFAWLGDAERTEAILDLPLQLSEQRQVILFSQESEVLAWAERHLTTTQHRVQRLPGPTRAA